MKNRRDSVVVSWSGGKDSARCLGAVEDDEDREVVGLLTTVDETEGRIPFHGVERRWIEAQADRLDLPVTVVELPPQPSNEVYERRLRPVVTDLNDQGVDAIAFGDLFLEEIRAYRERQMREAALDTIFPLWGRDTAMLARQIVDDGWQAIVTGVDTDQIDADILGRRYDHALLDGLPEGVDPCAENGEFHTFVVDGPLFSSPISVDVRRREIGDGRFRYVGFGESG